MGFLGGIVFLFVLFILFLGLFLFFLFGVFCCCFSDKNTSYVHITVNIFKLMNMSFKEEEGEEVVEEEGNDNKITAWQDFQIVPPVSQTGNS